MRRKFAMWLLLTLLVGACTRLSSPKPLKAAGTANAVFINDAAKAISVAFDAIRRLAINHIYSIVLVVILVTRLLRR